MPSEPDQQPPIVLLVDDAEPVRKILERTLAGRGYRLLSAAAPLEALNLLWQEGPVHLAVIDMELPGLSGESLSAALRRLQPDLRVLFVTGDVIVERAEEGPMLLKPFGPDTLSRCVGEYLETGCCEDCTPLIVLESSPASYSRLQDLG
jgi:two-component system cell cycle sensor histidine kinase/response regulator CckA